MTTLEQRLAATLAEHPTWPGDGERFCRCGIRLDNYEDSRAHLAAHLAATVREWLGGDEVLPEVRARVIEDVAREFQMGGWTILTAPPPAGAIPSLALGQRVVDWLHAWADEEAGS